MPPAPPSFTARGVVPAPSILVTTPGMGHAFEAERTLLKKIASSVPMVDIIIRRSLREQSA